MMRPRCPQYEEEKSCLQQQKVIQCFVVSTNINSLKNCKLFILLDLMYDVNVTYIIASIIYIVSSTVILCIFSQRRVVIVLFFTFILKINIYLFLKLTLHNLRFVDFNIWIQNSHAVWTAMQSTHS